MKRTSKLVVKAENPETLVRLRWKNTTRVERVAHSLMMLKARKAKRGY